MGLIKSGIKYGAIFAVAREGMKIIDRKTNGNNNNNAAQYPQQQPQQPMQVRDASGYLHQSWCNGQCGSHCNDGMMKQQQQGEVEHYFGKREAPPAY